VTLHQEHTVVIDRPVDEVFAFATDPNNDPLWQSTSLETEQTSGGRVDVGTTFRNTSKFLGRRIESTYEVTENEPPHRQCVKITSGPIPGTGCYLFESADGGSTVVAPASRRSSRPRWAASSGWPSRWWGGLCAGRCKQTWRR
jgi:hypothetical protein